MTTADPKKNDGEEAAEEEEQITTASSAAHTSTRNDVREDPKAEVEGDSNHAAKPDARGGGTAVEQTTPLSERKRQTDPALYWRLLLTEEGPNDGLLQGERTVLIFDPRNPGECVTPPLNLGCSPSMLVKVRTAPPSTSDASDFQQRLANALESVCRALQAGRKNSDVVFAQLADRATIVFQRISPSVVVVLMDRFCLSPLQLMKDMEQLGGTLRCWMGSRPQQCLLDARDRVHLRVLMRQQRYALDFALAAVMVLPMEPNDREYLTDLVRRIRTPTKLLSAFVIVNGQLAAMVVAKDVKITTVDVNCLRIVAMSQKDSIQEFLWPIHLQSGLDVQAFIRRGEGVGGGSLHLILLGCKDICRYVAALSTATAALLRDADLLQRLEGTMQTLPLLLPVRLAVDFHIRHVVCGTRRPTGTSAMTAGLRQLPAEIIKAAVVPHPGPDGEEWVRLIVDGKPAARHAVKVPYEWMNQSKKFPGVEVQQIHHFCPADPATGQETPCETDATLERLVPVYRKVLELAGVKEKTEKVVELTYEATERERLIVYCFYAPTAFVLLALESEKFPQNFIEEPLRWVIQQEKVCRVNIAPFR